MKAFLLDLVSILTFLALMLAGVFAMQFLFELLDSIIYGC